MRLTLPAVLCLSLALSSFAQNNEASAKSQERLQKEVRHELVMLPFLDVFDNLAYKVDGYNVTLMGQVTRPAKGGKGLEIPSPRGGNLVEISGHEGGKGVVTDRLRRAGQDH